MSLRQLSSSARPHRNLLVSSSFKAKAWNSKWCQFYWDHLMGNVDFLKWLQRINNYLKLLARKTNTPRHFFFVFLNWASLDIRFIKKLDNAFETSMSSITSSEINSYNSSNNNINNYKSHANDNNIKGPTTESICYLFESNLIWECSHVQDYIVFRDILIFIFVICSKISSQK